MSDIQPYPPPAILQVIPEEVMPLPSLIILAFHLTSLCIARMLSDHFNPSPSYNQDMAFLAQSRATSVTHTENENVNSAYDNAYNSLHL
jgi:hypothetical protein